MPKIEIELDDIEAARLQHFCGVNNISSETALQMLVHDRLEELVDSLIFEEEKNDGRQWH